MTSERTIVPEFEMVSCPTIKMDRCPRCKTLMLASRLPLHTTEQCDLSLVYKVMEG